MLKKYSGNLGTFEYNTDEYEIRTIFGSEKLHYIGTGENVTLPKGCIDCSFLFLQYSGNRLDLSKFRTTGVVSMEAMFSTCNVESLDLHTFDTSSVKTFRMMFSSDIRLKYLDISSFDVSNSDNFQFMFYNCDSLEFLDLSNMCIDKDTSNIETLMLDCKSLKAIILPSVNKNMVEGCISDATYRLLSTISSCKNLKYLIVDDSLKITEKYTGNYINDFNLEGLCKGLDSSDISVSILY